MINQGLDAYSTLTKEHWRNWAWKQLGARICAQGNARPLSWWEANVKARHGGRLKDKTVLYLVGPEDVDSEVACRIGFDRRNLIAVDINDENVKCARRNGGLAIRGNITDVLCSWPSDWPIHGVLADFCCGIGETALHFAIKAHTVKNGAFVVNLQRGRDWAGHWTGIAEMASAQYGLSEKHRGIAWLMHFFRWRLDVSYSDAVRYMPTVHPRFSSYRSMKSGRVYMDSVAITSLSDGYTATDCNEKVRRRISALRALRTMKMPA